MTVKDRCIHQADIACMINEGGGGFTLHRINDDRQENETPRHDVSGDTSQLEEIESSPEQKQSG